MQAQPQDKPGYNDSRTNSIAFGLGGTPTPGGPESKASEVEHITAAKTSDFEQGGFLPRISEMSTDKQNLLINRSGTHSLLG